MSKITLDSSVIFSRDAVFRDLDGEAVILDLHSGTYFGLNEVGCRIWQLIEQHGRLRPVLETLCEEYEAAPDVLEQDLMALVSKLAASGLGEVR